MENLIESIQNHSSAPSYLLSAFITQQIYEEEMTVPIKIPKKEYVPDTCCPICYTQPIEKSQIARFEPCGHT